jgi:signal transduction histidine kinase
MATLRLILPTGNVGRALRTLLPPVRSGRFWIVQAGVLSVALLHDIVLASMPGAGHAFGVPDAMTSAFLLIPVIYAALNYGVRGSVATAIWATALIAPHWWLMPDLSRSHLVIELGNLAVLYAVAIVVGQRVECEQRARRRAEEALATAVAEQQRRQEEQRAFSGRLLAVQEEQRRRLAQELHDDPLQNLMYLSRALDDLSEDPALDTSMVQRVSYDGELATEAATALRKIIHGLRPPVLDDLGIASALRQLVADVGRRGTLAVTLRCTGTETGLPPDLRLTAYRIVQEALNNVVRHAHARRATVRVQFGDPLTLTISDDGTGIPPSLGSADGPQPGLGLIGMRERATLAGGTLQVSTRSPHGTVIQATLPSTQAAHTSMPAAQNNGAPARE